MAREFANAFLNEYWCPHGHHTMVTTPWSSHYGHHTMVTTPRSPNYGLPKNIVPDRHSLYQQALMKVLDIRTRGHVSKMSDMSHMLDISILHMSDISTLGAITAYGRNSVTTLARIRLRITEVHKEATYEWNNNLIQTQQILCLNLQLARQSMEKLQGFENICLNLTLEIWS